MPNNAVTETDMPPKRRFFRRPWIMLAAVAVAGLAVLAITYAVQYFSARANLDAAIAEARANAEPVWFSDLDPGAERNPSKDAREWLAMLSEIDIWEVNDPIETKVESLLHPEWVEGEVKFTPKEYKRFEKYASTNAKILEEMAAIARRQDCWFEYDYETVKTVAIPLPHFDELRFAHRAAIATILAARGNENPAGLDVGFRQYFDLTDHLRNEFFLGSQMIRIRHIDQGITLLEHAARKISAEDLATDRLVDQVSQLEKEVRLGPTVRSMRAATLTTMTHLDDPDNKMMLAYLLAGMNAGKGNSNWFDELLNKSPEERTVARWNSFIHRPQLLNLQAYVINLMRQQADLIDRPGPIATSDFALLEQAKPERKDDHKLLSILLTGLAPARGETMAVRQRLINAALLLKFASQHGNSPDELAIALETAIDAAPAGYFSGKPLKFKVEDSAISVYDINPEDGNPVGLFTLTLSSNHAAQVDTANSTSSEEGAP